MSDVSVTNSLSAHAINTKGAVSVISSQSAHAINTKCTVSVSSSQSAHAINTTVSKCLYQQRDRLGGDMRHGTTNT